MMARKICAVFFLGTVLIVSLAGCAAKKEGLTGAKTGKIPGWFAKTPESDDYLYAAATATSKDLQLAIEKATASARSEIGRQLEARIQALQKRFDEEVGLSEDAEISQQFSSAVKVVVSTSLTGSRIAKQKQFRDGNIWRAYVLVEYPIGEANVALLKQLKSQEKVYTRLRAAQAFKELEEEVRRFEEWKRQGIR